MLRATNPLTLRADRRDIAYRLSGLAAALAVAALVIRIPFPLDAAVVTAPAAALILLAHPFLVPIGLLASVPVQDYLPVPEGVPLTATRGMIAAGMAIAPIVILTRYRRLEFSRFMILVGAYCAAIALSLWNAAAPDAGYAELYRWLVALFGFWMVIQFVRTRTHVLLVAALFGLLAAGQGVLGTLQAVFGYGPESFEIGLGFSRAYGTFGMPNSYAAYLEVVTLPLIPLAAWSLCNFWNRFSKYRRVRLGGFLATAPERREVVIAASLALVLFAGVAAGLVGILFSFSRGGWLGSAAAIAVMVIMLGRRTIIVSFLTAALVSLTLLISTPGMVISVLDERFSQIVDQARIGDIRGMPVTDDNFATMERMAHWYAAIEMWDDRPWLGIGAGNFDLLFREYTVHPRFIDSQGHAHNYYLHALGETGIIGLLTYLAMLVAALSIGWRAFRSPDTLARSTGIAAIGVTVALIVHNMFENLHVLNISIQILGVWGLAIVASRWCDNSQSREIRGHDRKMLYDSGEHGDARLGTRSENVNLDQQ